MRHDVDSSDPRLRVLALTNMWPTRDDPSYGVFVASQMRSVAVHDVDVEIEFVNGRVGNTAYLRAAMRMLALNFRRPRFDLVHAHTGHCGVLARLQWRHPVLVSYVGYDLYGKPKARGGITVKSRLEAMLFRQLARFLDATITKSAGMETLIPVSARPRNTVLPNGVDRALFQLMPREAARKQLGWPNDEITVLFAGNPDVVRKRFALAQEACEHAARDVRGLRLRVCTGLEHASMPLLMNAADLLLLTSVAEGSPNTVKEALTCDLPVVATDVGDVSELLAGVSRCRVVPVESDAYVVAEALIDVLRDAPQRSDGRRKTSHLAVEGIAAQLTAIYVRVAGRDA